jgi:pyruvate/2-oxoglutarate/acetoin dehydrogenase E1 component
MLPEVVGTGLTITVICISPLRHVNLDADATTNNYQIGSHIVDRRTISKVCSGILNQGQ